MTTARKPRATKPKVEKQETLEEGVGVQAQSATANAARINSQQGYIGNLPEYVLIKVTDNLGDSVDLVFSYPEIAQAAQRSKVNVQQGIPALIKDIVAR
jgi:hypothetical protein